MAALIDCPGITQPLHPIAGAEQLDVSSVIQALTVPQDALMAIVNVQNSAARWRDDGSDPGADEGVLQKADTFFSVCGSAMSRIRFRRNADTNTRIFARYYGMPN